MKIYKFLPIFIIYKTSEALQCYSCVLCNVKPTTAEEHICMNNKNYCAAVYFKKADEVEVEGIVRSCQGYASNNPTDINWPAKQRHMCGALNYIIGFALTDLDVCQLKTCNTDLCNNWTYRDFQHTDNIYSRSNILSWKNYVVYVFLYFSLVLT